MTWPETLRTAWDAIRTRRMRSALTVLGILIGIAAVMLTVGLGQGAQQQVASQIGKLGSNLLIVSPGLEHQPDRDPRWARLGDHPDDGGRRDARRPHGRAGRARGRPDVEHLDRAHRERHRTGPPASSARPPTGCRCAPAPSRPAGCSPRPSSPACSPRWCSGSTTADELFGVRDPVGQTVTIGAQPFTVIGVLDTVGSTVGGDQDDQAIVPATTYATLVSPVERHQRLDDLPGGDQPRHPVRRLPGGDQRAADHPRGHLRHARTSASTARSRSSRPRPAPRAPSPCCSAASRRSRCSSAASAS